MLLNFVTYNVLVVDCPEMKKTKQLVPLKEIVQEFYCHFERRITEMSSRHRREQKLLLFQQTEEKSIWSKMFSNQFFHKLSSFLPSRQTSINKVSDVPREEAWSNNLLDPGLDGESDI